MYTEQYCIYTLDPNFVEVLNWVSANDIRFEPHLNRTRFWVPKGPLYTEFCLRFFHCTSRVVD